MGEESENIFLKRRQKKKEQQKYETVFSITNYEGNTNSNHSVTLLHISHGHYKKLHKFRQRQKNYWSFQ